MIALARRAMVAALLAGFGIPVICISAMSNESRPKSAGQLIGECMRELDRGQSVGRRKMTPQQRMTAEAQCRARAEAAIADRKN
ncbi:hypothetical protein [uncultured Ferrovibrio sp.]|jgi:hypothetical protein|uniref:hypothetical protein n=1 Tax=uncultured Ferrovibrio sp. TaxID=1576913 RepID=UPI00261D923D|nr:hypothetical protein [uncultured Ferrovibrio sp.]